MKFNNAKDKGRPIIIKDSGAGISLLRPLEMISPMDEADNTVTPSDSFFG